MFRGSGSRNAESLRFLQIEPTTRCNFTCGFCVGRKMPQQDLPSDIFAHALSLSEDLTHLELQGEGEPLLNRDFFEFVERARKRGIKVSLISNGSLLSERMVRRILDLGIEKLWVSVESVDPVRFQEIRGGRLEQVEAGLRRLLAARRARALERPAVGLSVNVLRSTQEEIPAIRALYDRLGLDGGLVVQLLQRMESYTEIYDEGMTSEILAELEAESFRARLLVDPEMRRLLKTGAKGGFYDELMRGWRPGSRRCPWLENGAYVHLDGSVTPCCRVKDSARYGLGQVGVDPPQRILAARRPLREALAQRIVPPPCQGCEIAHYAAAPPKKLVTLVARALWRRCREFLVAPPR